MSKRKKSILTLEILEAIHNNLNRALEHYRECPITGEDDVFKAISKITFPVDVLIAAGRFEKPFTMSTIENVYGWKIPEHMQLARPTAVAVAATMTFAFVNHLDLRMMVVNSKTYAGYSFQPGKQVGIVIITDSILEPANPNSLAMPAEMPKV